MGTYTTEAKVEGIVQFAITDSTAPTTTQVATWITEIEADYTGGDIPSRRFPVRFIKMKCFNALQELVVHINKLNIEVYKK